jgi:hypothetical protein
VDIKIIGQVCLRGSELKKIIYLGFVPFAFQDELVDRLLFIKDKIFFKTLQ